MSKTTRIMITLPNGQLKEIDTFLLESNVFSSRSDLLKHGARLVLNSVGVKP